MKLIRFSAYLVILCCLAACSFGTETKIHNQLETNLIVEINDDTYELIPNQSVEVSYEYGENRIKSTSENKVLVDTVVNITRKMTDEGALINVTGKPYYIMIERYGGSMYDNPLLESMIVTDDSTSQNYKILNDYNEKKRKRMMEHMKIVVIDSVTIIGNIKTLPANQIVIPRDWYYGLGSKFEESIESSNTTDSFFGKSVKKIFSEQELLTYWYSE
jgi:hypothetical protein